MENVVTIRLDSLQLSPQSVALAHGILLGDKQYLTTQEIRDFRTAGMSHIIAVSGLHVGILFLVIFLALKPMSFIRQLKLQRILSVIAVWAYVAMIGCPVSAVRAALMLSLAVLAWVLERNTSPLRLLCSVALIMVLYDYHQLTNVGFQLSMLATLGILLCSPLLQTQGRLMRLLTVTVSAQLATFPVVAYYFHLVPLFGFIQGLAVIPLLTLLMYLLVLYLLFPAFTLFSYPIDWITRWIFSVADFTTRIEHYVLGGSLYCYPSLWEAVLMEALCLALVVLCKQSLTHSSTGADERK